MSYPTSELKIAGEGVIWIMPDGTELHGFAKFTPAGKLTAVVLTPDGDRIDLPQASAPPHWRPRDPDNWEYSLPDHAVNTVLDDMDAVDSDDWPYPGVRLGGANDIPQSCKECEARILRCLRTHWHQEWTPKEPGAWAWPPRARTEIRKRERLLRESRTGRNGIFFEEDYDHYHAGQKQRDGVSFNDGELRARPARFQPTNRDISDYEADLRPTEFIPKTWGGIFNKRAGSPPHSWEAISWSMRRKDVEGVLQEYEQAVDEALRAWRRAWIVLTSKSSR